MTRSLFRGLVATIVIVSFGLAVGFIPLILAIVLWAILTVVVITTPLTAPVSRAPVAPQPLSAEERGHLRALGAAPLEGVAHASGPSRVHASRRGVPRADN